jgi:hypothetical protein
LLLQLDTINIDRWEWEKEGGACSSGRGDPAERTASALLQNIIRGEYLLNNAKINRILTFLLCCSSLRSILIRERRCGESLVAVGEEISRGTVAAIPSNIMM